MSPESLQQGKYSIKTDVYSYAITMIEVLTRKQPYDGQDPVQVAISVAMNGLRPTIPASCPASLASLLKDCWNTDPEQRPDFDAIYEKLEQIETELV